MAKHKKARRVVAAGGLGALALAWLQAKAGEHPPRFGWLEGAVAAGLAAGWLLGTHKRSRR